MTATATDSACPRCGTPFVRGQEYCLACGVRLGRRLRDDRPRGSRQVRLRVLSLGVAAAAGAALGIWQARSPADAERVVTALGGSVPITKTKPAAPTLVVWPRRKRGWTIVLSSVPKVDGRDKAVALAQEAHDAKLEDVGVLDSSGYASLRPGYWLVFQGIYGSEAEANGALRQARRASKAARVQAVS
ncbi:MAG: hypothetical protein U0R50_12000 [Gaiellales bacterium]